MPPRLADSKGLYELTRRECLQLLEQCRVGRIGITSDALPVILPVNYVLLDDLIIFRTVPGTKLAAATRNAVVAFEVDSYDLQGIAGWSVLVVGRTSIVRDGNLIARACEVPLEPWALGEAAYEYVHVEAERVTGRRFDHRSERAAGSDAGF